MASKSIQRLSTRFRPSKNHVNISRSVSTFLGQNPTSSSRNCINTNSISDALSNPGSFPLNLSNHQRHYFSSSSQNAQYSTNKNQSPYEILGVSPSASPEELKKAYKRKAMEFHPDRNPDNREESERKFKEVSQAYKMITEGGGQMPGQGGFPGGPGGPFGGQGGGFGGGAGPFRHTQTQQMSPDDAERMFRDMFGGKNFHDIFSEMFNGHPDFNQGSRSGSGSGNQQQKVIPVTIGDKLTVSKDVDAIKRAVRQRPGIGSDNDALREKLAGRTGEVIKMDSSDNTVKMRFRNNSSRGSTAVEDCWYPAEVLFKEVDMQQQQQQQGFNPFGFDSNLFGSSGFGGGSGLNQHMQRFHHSSNSTSSSSNGSSGGSDVVSEETYTQVVQGPQGQPQLRVVTVRKRRDGSSERIVQTQPL